MKNNLPLTTIDWSKKFNRQKIIYFLIAILLAFFVALNGYQLLHRAQKNSELVEVVIASKNIPKNTKAQKDTFQFRKIRRDQIPGNAITNPQDIIGQTSLVDISQNQIIVSQFFKEITNPNSISTQIADNRVAISVGFDWLTAPVPDIKAGDVIDIIASESHKVKTEQGEILKAEAQLPIQNAKVLKVVKKGDYDQSGHLVLEVSQEQAKNLMSTKALKLLLNIIVK